MKPKSSKKIELVKRAIDSAEILNKKYIKTINVVEDRFTNDEIIVKVRFYHGMISDSGRDETLDDIWQTVYNYTGIPVGLVNLNKLENNTLTESEDKTPKLLEKFMENIEIEGICGFWVDPEEDIDSRYWVYLIVDKDWLENQEKPLQRMKINLQKEIKKFLNVDVMIGITVRKCSEMN